MGWLLAVDLAPLHPFAKELVLKLGRFGVGHDELGVKKASLLQSPSKEPVHLFVPENQAIY